MLLTIAMPVQLPKMQFFDQQGKPLVGGKIYSYKVGTGEFKPTYKNAQKTALNKNPVVLDGAGCAFIYLNGNHHLKIFDKQGQLIEERWVPSTEFRTFFFDKFGKALRFGKVYTHDFESTMPKPSYQNPEKSFLNPNPIILDDDGSAMICINGSYRLRVYDEKGVFQGDQDFFRNVAYALTSKPYPNYFDERISASISLEKVVVHDAQNIQESVGSSITLLTASVRELQITYPVEIGSINSTLILPSAQITKEVSYLNLKIDPLHLNSQISVVSAQTTKEFNFLKYQQEPTSVQTNISLTDAVLIQG